MNRCFHMFKRQFHSGSSVLRRGQIHSSIIETIGNTPIVKVNNVKPRSGAKGVQIHVKCEFFNPLSSVKDRLAIGIIEDAERTGKLKPGQTVVEATSGNTGIATAFVCAQKGYPCVVTMAEPFSVERRRIMRALGAKVIVTPAAEKGSGMVNKAQELAAKHGWFEMRQFENEANSAYHANSTGPEILNAYTGQRLDWVVMGYGTGGTFSGAGRVLKAARPDLKLAIAEPANAQMVGSGQKQERRPDGSASKSHPSWNPHPIQGWAPDFIAKLVEDGLQHDVVDMVLPVEGAVGIETALRLCKEEGIFTGPSGGAAMAVALDVAENHAKDGDVITAVLADTAERYLSTPMFEKINAEMNEEEVEISKSTPNYQLNK